MLKSIGNMFAVMLALLKYPVFFVLAVFIIFFADCMVWYFIRYAKGDRVNKGSVRKPPNRNLFLKVFVDAPRQYVDDLYNRKPDFFLPQGLVIFTGRQGNGKTISLMQYAMELLDTYPKARCISNTQFTLQDEQLKHWTQLINYKNGHMGVIVIIDELQNWFSSNSSRNFPPDMLSVITQNRKNRRVILGTAQNFYLLAKPIRSQCTEIRECLTLAGVLTIVVRREPVVDNDGEVKQLKYRGMYCFAHDRRLRDSYDTYSVIENLAKSGFYQNPALVAQMIREGEK